jgi:hypothetical protein
MLLNPPTRAGSKKRAAIRIRRHSLARMAMLRAPSPPHAVIMPGWTGPDALLKHTTLLLKPYSTATAGQLATNPPLLLIFCFVLFFLSFFFFFVIFNMPAH